MTDPASPAPSRATHVTLFEDRAEVTRTAVVRAASGWIAVGGAGPYVDDSSVRATALRAPALEADATISAVRLRRRAELEPRAGREAVGLLEEELRAADAGLQDAVEALASAEADTRRAEQLLADWISALHTAPPLLAEPAREDEWRAAHAALDEAATGAVARHAAAQAAEVAAREDRSRALHRLHEGRLLTPRIDSVVEVQVEGVPEGAEVEIEIGYRTPCALWRPEHLARFDPATGEIEIVTHATAWQRTGEVWDGVEVTFSTARTARTATPPTLASDVLSLRRRTDEERRQVVVEARDQMVATTGEPGGTRTVDEMPGLDDGGLPLALRPAGPVSLASDGRPFRVEVARLRLPAQVERVLMPERAGVAHLRATCTLPDGVPLLAGPVTVARGPSVVGRSTVDFVAPGERLVLGLGVDDAVRVRREVRHRRDAATVTGTQTVTNSVTVWVSNLSGEPRAVGVVERVPVSEIEDLSVRVDAPGWEHDARDGFARRTVELGPRQSTTVELGYTLRAGSRVSLPPALTGP